jgi:cysteinyl-tRNA synthetase
VWDVAEKFTQQFFDSTDQLNVVRPNTVCKATDHISEQIQLIKTLEEKGFTYQIEDGVYFDTAKFPEYGSLSNLDQVKAGARVEFNQSKRNSTDFALWKFSDPSEKRQMEWESPWGKGFPGWHIECSAMSMKYLGEQFDIHTGGIDHIETHHPNEIAQSEAATGKKPFVRLWMHHNFLLVDGQKMSKSLGNLYTIDDIKAKGIEPMALRYLYLQTHYRKELNFTFESLSAAAQALKRLRAVSSKIQITNNKSNSDFESDTFQEYQEQFKSALADDLNTAQALAVVWDVVKDKTLSDDVKVGLVLDFDRVLGLELEATSNERRAAVPAEIQTLLDTREQLRKAGDYAQADALRDKIIALGYEVTDK